MLRFNTSKPGDEQNSFEGDVDRMKEGQNDMCHITDESIAVVSSSSFLENLRKNGYEVPYMTDPVDENAVHQPKDFDGTKLKSTAEEGFDFGDQDEKSNTSKSEDEEFNLKEYVDEMTTDLVTDSDGKVSDKILDDTVCPDSLGGFVGPLQQEQPQQHRSQQGAAQREEEQKQTGMGAGKKEEKDEKDEVKEKEEKDGKVDKIVMDAEIQIFVKEEAEEERHEEVKEDVMGWTVVTRNRKQQRRMIQIYVKVNGGRAIPTEVNLTDDKVEDVMRQIPSSEDMYVTMHGRVLKRSEKLKSCEVTDGCTIQVMSRLRGGGRNKNKTAGEKRKKSPKKVEQNDRSTEEKNLPGWT